MARVKAIPRRSAPSPFGMYRVRVNLWRYQPFKEQWTPTTRGMNPKHRGLASRVELAHQLGLDIDQTACRLVFRD